MNRVNIQLFSVYGILSHFYVIVIHAYLILSQTSTSSCIISVGRQVCDSKQNKHSLSCSNNGYIPLIIFYSTVIVILPAVLCATGDISVGPSNRVTPSTDVKITCSVNRNQNPRAYVIWKRQIGSFTVDLGTNVGLKQDFSSRYSLDVESSGGVDTFSLSIKGMDLE